MSTLKFCKSLPVSGLGLFLCFYLLANDAQAAVTVLLEIAEPSAPGSFAPATSVYDVDLDNLSRYEFRITATSDTPESLRFSNGTVNVTPASVDVGLFFDPGDSPQGGFGVNTINPFITFPGGFMVSSGESFSLANFQLGFRENTPDGDYVVSIPSAESDPNGLLIVRSPIGFAPITNSIAPVTFRVRAAAVPEPSSLFGLGLGSIVMIRRRPRRGFRQNTLNM